MKNPTITLSAYNTMIEDQPEWDRWKSYVCEHLDAACGFEVNIDSFTIGRAPEQDRIDDATVEQELTIREAVQRLWDNYSSGN